MDILIPRVYSRVPAFVVNELICRFFFIKIRLKISKEILTSLVFSMIFWTAIQSDFKKRLTIVLTANHSFDGVPDPALYMLQQIL